MFSPERKGALRANIRQASVLIVDDDAGNLGASGHVLRSHYDVLATPTGVRALQIAASTQQPDLILLDVVMSGMNGYVAPS